MAKPDTCVSKMAKCRVWITTSTESETSLHSPNSSEDLLAADVWPPLPIVIWFGRFEKWPGRADNIIAAFEQHHRVCEIELNDVPGSQLLGSGMKRFVGR